MFEVLQSRIVLFVLATVCWCSQAICAGGGWGVLSAQDRADINALLPGLAVPGAGLWGAPRTNSSVVGQTVREHYEEGHGANGDRTRTLPFFGGIPVAAVGGVNPATAEEVVMARFIASLAPPLPPGSPPVVPPTALVRKKDGDAREIRIPVPPGMAQITRKGSRTMIRGARFYSVLLPAIPTGFPAGGAPAPTNICTHYIY